VKGWLECTARRWAEASGRALCRYKSVAVPVRREVGTQTISSEREVGNAAGRLATNLAPEASLPSLPLQSVSGSHSLPLHFSLPSWARAGRLSSQDRALYLECYWFCDLVNVQIWGRVM